MDSNSQKELSISSLEQRKSLPATTELETVKAAPPSIRFGFRGYIRLTRILFTFSIFALRVILNTFSITGRRKIPDASKRRQEGASLRERLLKLGPTFIKVGQAVGTRADILPFEYIEELSKLQDEVPPIPSEQARAIIESELGSKIEDAFAGFDEEPIAAASLAQVHRASLKNGRQVVIKVQRPNLMAQIDLDLVVLKRISRWLEHFPHFLKGIDWEGYFTQFRSTICDELDFKQETRNAEIFRTNFSRWKEVYVPRIYNDMSTGRIIVMEYIPGIKVNDAVSLKRAGRNPHEVMKLLSRTYLKQLLEDGFFHADPHPGNLRVMNDGRLAFFDFGMVGRLEVELQSELISAFFHIIERDIQGLVEDMIRLGFIELTPEEEAKFKPTLEVLFDRYLGMRLGDIQFKEVFFDLAQVIYEFPFRIPSSFTYIIRAGMTLEGIGTQVDPSFNFFEVARPYAKRFMFMREGRYLRTLILNRLIRGESNTIKWDKVWKLAKMAIKYYLRGEDRL